MPRRNLVLTNPGPKPEKLETLAFNHYLWLHDGFGCRDHFTEFNEDFAQVFVNLSKL
jgi:hypothetical protein